MFHLSDHRPGESPGNVRRGRSAAMLLAAALLFVHSSPAHAQQFVVDDAPVGDFRACQLETWHGRLAGWALPACQPLRNLEITPGIGWVRDFGDGWDLEFVLQGKYVLRELEPNGFGYSLAGGIGLGPLAQVLGREFDEVFAYVPLSISRFDDQLVLHLNAGWSLERGTNGEGEGLRTRDHHFTWGVRSDIVLSERFTVIGEIFSEDRVTPEYQVGLRTTLVPDRLEVDVSYGDRFGGGIDEDRPGLVVGFAWTPPPFF
jgi:hypothetical protein